MDVSGWNRLGATDATPVLVTVTYRRVLPARFAVRS